MAFPPRLGAASLQVNWSDALGFQVLHGTTGEELVRIDPKNLEREDWDRFWWAIRDLEIRAFERTEEFKKIVQATEEAAK